MKIRKPCPLAVSLLLALACLFGHTAVGLAQPTYKLEVKPNLKPLAKLELKGTRIVRTAVKDDPGFRLQYHFKKNGKTLKTVEARANPSLEVPEKTPGRYTVVLELFYPSYKGGDKQKGEFKSISNELTYRVDPAAKPSDPVKITLVEPPKPPPAKRK
ncbi:MAG TPA: hypothetical protein VKI65_12655 [Gemmataceae bacterium]|nr:hypothetical protein [Gemmataceae bacterium]